MKRRNWLPALFFIMSLPFFATSSISASPKKESAQGKEVSFDAVFEDRSGVRHAWTHVKIRRPDGESTKIETKDGDTIIHISLAKITKFSLVDEKATPEGYAKATIAFPDGSEKTYELRVEERGESISLVGSTKGGEGEITLLKCKFVQFSVPAPSTEEKRNEHQPAKK
jgi:hypothetical protein